ncbi:MAG: helix-turn-helix domain-containing protein [Kordiimonas sp.]
MLWDFVTYGWIILCEEVVILGVELGVSPIAYVKRRRLERSKQLLEGTDMPYGRIASAVGFASADRFSKAFKETFDITPSDYRYRFGSST